MFRFPQLDEVVDYDDDNGEDGANRRDDEICRVENLDGTHCEATFGLLACSIRWLAEMPWECFDGIPNTTPGLSPTQNYATVGPGVQHPAEAYTLLRGYCNNSYLS